MLFPNSNSKQRPWGRKWKVTHVAEMQASLRETCQSCIEMTEIIETIIIVQLIISWVIDVLHVLLEKLDFVRPMKDSLARKAFPQITEIFIC